MRAIGRQAAVSFKVTWRLQGKPRLKIIKPISAWTLASGITYDHRRDRFMSGGSPVDVDWRLQPYIEVPFLPSKKNTNVDFAIPGIVTGASTNVEVLWTQIVKDALDTAWGVSINGVLHRVKNIDMFPEGVDVPISLYVELEESRSTT